MGDTGDCGGGWMDGRACVGGGDGGIRKGGVEKEWVERILVFWKKAGGRLVDGCVHSKTSSSKSKELFSWGAVGRIFYRHAQSGLSSRDDSGTRKA